MRFLRLVGLVVVIASPTAGRAQTEDPVSAATVEAAAAAARGICGAQVGEITAVVEQLRASDAGVVGRALRAYLVGLRNELATCVAAVPAVPPAGTSEAPRGRFAAVTGASDESGAGDFDVQAVIRLINTRRAAITRCYEAELLATPSLRGRVTVSITIETSGSVNSVRALENTTGSTPVAECLVRVIAGFRFTPGPEGGSVTYSFPFTFEPVGP